MWDVAAAVVRTVQIVAQASEVNGAGDRGDEIGVLMSSFSRMITTIEDQAGQINTFAAQLGTAYKELEATNDRLKELSFKDEVTELCSRRFLFIRLEEEINRFRRFGHPLSLVLLDLDDFEEINDGLGHAAGDDTLRDIAQLMIAQSRSDTIIARYGGDEFAILLVNTPKSGAHAYAERMRQALADCTFSHGQPVTAGFGIASLPEDIIASSADTIRAADKALYESKRAGKNSVTTYAPLVVHSQAAWA